MTENNYAKTREEWVEMINDIAKLSYTCIQGQGRPLSDSKIKWARTMVYAIQTGARLINDAKIEELEKRIVELEYATKK